MVYLSSQTRQNIQKHKRSPANFSEIKCKFLLAPLSDDCNTFISLLLIKNNSLGKNKKPEQTRFNNNQ